MGHVFLVAYSLVRLICWLNVDSGEESKKEERNIKTARGRQVSTFPRLRQQAQQHRKPAQAGLKEDRAQDPRQQCGRGTQRPLISGSVISGTGQF